MASRVRLFSSLTSLLLRRAAEKVPPRRPPRSFSSSSSAGEDEFLSCFDGGGGEVSPAYRRHLQFHRPPTERQPWRLPPNTCSLIGKVAAPLRRCDSRSGRLGVYTWLEVEKAPWADHRRAFSPFQILIMMWNKLANASLKFLKPNDFIYVSGHLSSYEKFEGNGKREIKHKVIVKDLNYVQQSGEIQASQNPHRVVDDVLECSSENLGESAQEKEDGDRLHLWQVFFANPHEWWDNRHDKPYQSCPDFKHKHTCECLFLCPDDPPWIKRQLELYDSGKTGSRRKNLGGAHTHISEFL